MKYILYKKGSYVLKNMYNNFVRVLTFSQRATDNNIVVDFNPIEVTMWE